MTELAYLSSLDAAYERRFASRVQALPPGAVVLDRTFFYPTGGGQPADLGRLVRPGGEGAWPVVDVQRTAGVVLHKLGRAAGSLPPLQPGETLEGEIDWERRHRHMRLHTGQHLLSARLFALSGRRTSAARFSGDRGAIDLESGPMGLPPTDSLERDVNDWIHADRPVQIRFLPRAEYARSPARRSSALALPPSVDPVRVVLIEEADECPCGGTHVRRLGEVGPLELEPPTPLAGGTIRVSFRLARESPPTPSG